MPDSSLHIVTGYLQAWQSGDKAALDEVILLVHGELIRIAQADGWPGYFGSPRLARRSQYEKGWKLAQQQAIRLALKILDGLDERWVARFGEEMKKSE